MVPKSSLLADFTVYLCLFVHMVWSPLAGGGEFSFSIWRGLELTYRQAFKERCISTHCSTAGAGSCSHSHRGLPTSGIPSCRFEPRIRSRGSWGIDEHARGSLKRARDSRDQYLKRKQTTLHYLPFPIASANSLQNSGLSRVKIHIP